MNDHLFGLLLGLFALGCGLVASVVATPETPATARLREPLLVAERGPLAAPRLEESGRAAESPPGIGEAPETSSMVRPQEPPRLWHGVAVVRLEDRNEEAGAFLARLEGHLSHEEGPPVHFAVDSRRAACSSRWRRQRPWRLEGVEEEPTGWIVVALLGPGPFGSHLEALLEELGRAPFEARARLELDELAALDDRDDER